MFAGMSQQHNGLITHIGKSTNITDFGIFAEKLIQALPVRAKYAPKPALILDNASAHKNKTVRAKLEKHFQVLFTPTCSCQFNSVEWLFSIIKNNYRKRITKCALRRDYGQEDVVNCIILACEEISNEKVYRLCRANRPYINSYLPAD